MTTTKPHVQLRLVRPEALNPSQHLFAGTASSWFVEECYLCAVFNFPHCHFVCRTVKNLEMVAPVNVGDVLCYSGTCEIGKTSIIVDMVVSRQNDNKVVTKGQVVFVNINSEGKATPHNIVLQ
ncbi:acyl-CoA hydrolase, putative [Entamoeba histolytica HM-1:IMSS-B]|uniref:Acyl-CoA hydrolase, putative n=4 Tax=Entamoeba histolytica TaxID=5759 RepID=C4M796_ENTH1|nr:acyl-CoA hydrolase, putative [Entamoeba histolytica HM-1:IMSS]EAL45152.1 acyl-CoA hydrolase, putative [Entamoeba histolytica HM-1:IMSS]EMH72556.1 acyl-CoA hydrolase, putative [Entamoeba histolytica HM-1:IMSS-B]ENY60398.1 acyl-CoA hydrolase, putative [Entamoeba histolytica HM-1:IMSS-A]GAT97394.1 acyl-coa hydrolase putative [Entamoeba histolytica]|eukprot:XP_650539.1 acyl-CoA hydrolase, putative [Entamoeba histolytica HM-1:IMSS]